MDERRGTMTAERLGLHKADCRAAGGKLAIPCTEGVLYMSGPHPEWKYKLYDGYITEEQVLTLHQVTYSY